MDIGTRTTRVRWMRFDNMTIWFILFLMALIIHDECMHSFIVQWHTHQPPHIAHTQCEELFVPPCFCPWITTHKSWLHDKWLTKRSLFMTQHNFRFQLWKQSRSKASVFVFCIQASSCRCTQTPFHDVFVLGLDETRAWIFIWAHISIKQFYDSDTVDGTHSKLFRFLKTTGTLHSPNHSNWNLFRIIFLCYIKAISCRTSNEMSDE